MKKVLLCVTVLLLICISFEALSDSVRINIGSNPNVRTEPSTNSTIIGNVKSNHEYELISVSNNNWYKIRLENGQTGWISGAMATIINKSTTTMQIRINSGSNPNVRSKPSTDGQVLGNAKSGQVFELLATSGSWYKIRLANGTEGWIASGMATLIGTTTSSTQSNKTTPKSTVKPNSGYKSDRELIEMAKGYFYLRGGSESGITGTGIDHKGDVSYVSIAYNYTHCYIIKVDRKTGRALGMTKQF